MLEVLAYKYSEHRYNEYYDAQGAGTGDISKIQTPGIISLISYAVRRKEDAPLARCGGNKQPRIQTTCTFYLNPVEVL
jgi:hypothetical protein